LFYQEYSFPFIPELFSVSKFFMIFKAKILNSIYVCVLKSAPEIFKIIIIFDSGFISSGDLSRRLGITLFKKIIDFSL